MVKYLLLQHTNTEKKKNRKRIKIYQMFCSVVEWRQIWWLDQVCIKLWFKHFWSRGDHCWLKKSNLVLFNRFKPISEHFVVSIKNITLKPLKYIEGSNRKLSKPLQTILKRLSAILWISVEMTEFQYWTYFHRTSSTWDDFMHNASHWICHNYVIEL